MRLFLVPMTAVEDKLLARPFVQIGWLNLGLWIGTERFFLAPITLTLRVRSYPVHQLTKILLVVQVFLQHLPVILLSCDSSSAALASQQPLLLRLPADKTINVNDFNSCIRNPIETVVLKKVRLLR